MKSETERTDNFGHNSVSEMSVGDHICKLINEAELKMNTSRRRGQNIEAIYQQGRRDALQSLRDWITAPAGDGGEGEKNAKK